MLESILKIIMLYSFFVTIKTIVTAAMIVWECRRMIVDTWWKPLIPTYVLIPDIINVNKESVNW